MVAAIPPSSPVSERIRRLARRYQTTTPRISVERARFYTRSWQATEGLGLPLGVRVARALQHVYENVTIYVDADEEIAGAWTESFVGVPIDIERGVFNEVLRAELTRTGLLKARLRSLAKGAGYLMKKKGGLRELMRTRKINVATGGTPLNLAVTTMAEREINAFDIDPQDRDELLDELLPVWRGKTLVDILDRALAESGLYCEDMLDFAMAVPGNTSRQVFMLATCATIASLQGHLIPDLDRALVLGLEGMREQVADALAAPDLEPGERDFLHSIEVVLAGVVTFACRLAQAVAERARATSGARRAILEEMAATCRKVPLEPAETFAEAVQSLWTVKTALELAHPVNLHCFGRLDQSLFPYYQRDLAAGRVTPARARERLEELLLKLMSQNLRPESNILSGFYHRFLGSTPVTVGGLTRDGQDGTNELTYLFLDAAHNSKAITNVSVRVHPATDDALLHRVGHHLHDGTSSFSIFNDDKVIEAMQRRGFALEDARDYAIMGCVEATCPGKTGSMSANALLLNRLLDITLRNGDAKTLAGTVRGEGPRTGDTFASFDELLGAFQRQASYFIAKIVDGSNLRDRLFAEHLPAPAISAFMDGCLKKRADVTRGGATYDLSGISMINSIANLVDSLYVIDQLVFQQKRFTLQQLREAIDANYVGHEGILAAIQQLPGKWGNGAPVTDELAHRVAKALFAETYCHQSFKGGPFVVYLISMTTHTIDGRLSIASPDGRRAARPYAASGNPYNVDRAGVTATLRSVASLPFEDVMGAAINIKLHPSAIGESEAVRAKWIALVRTYFALGGMQVQPTVASAEVLRHAQREPEAHRDLIVKVGGYSTYFVDLGAEIQQEVIERTEHR